MEDERKSNIYTKLGQTHDRSNNNPNPNPNSNSNPNPNFNSNGMDNYNKGCQFSPDGLCILTCTALDNILHLYNTPMKQTNERIHSVLTYKEGDCIRDYTWYPNMNSNDPSSCVFLSAAKEQPLHLIDAYTSQLRASYRAYNDKDELISPACCLFSSNGERILTTSSNPHLRSVFVFHTNLPGNQYDTWNLGKTRKSKDGQKGMISTISNANANASTNVNANLYAIGTRNPSSIYLYDDRISTSDIGHVHTFTHWDSTVLLGHGKHYTRKQTQTQKQTQKQTQSPLHHETNDFFSIAKQKWYNQNAKGTGINQLQFGRNEHNSHLLYSSARRSNAIVAWDLRMLTNTQTKTQAKAKTKSYLFQTSILFPRSCCDTNQTLFFDIDDHCNRLYVPHLNSHLDQHQHQHQHQHLHSIQVYDASTGQVCKDLEMSSLHNVPNGVSIVPSPFVPTKIKNGNYKNNDNNTDDDDDDDDMNNDDPTSILAVSFGSRHFVYPYENEDDESDTSDNDSTSIKNNHYTSNNDMTMDSYSMNTGLTFFLT